MFSQMKKIMLFRNFPCFELSNSYKLRALEKSDASAWLRYLKHAAVSKYIPDPCIPVSVSHAEKEILWYINLFHTKKGFAWAIAEPKNNQIVGTISIEKWVPYHKRCEIAYDLNPEYWGQGIMSTAIKQCLYFAFKKMDVVRIEAYTTLCNERSQALLTRIGFQHEAVMRKQRWFKNKHIDVNLYAITDDDFNQT